jgi:hypothetical protein
MKSRNSEIIALVTDDADKECTECSIIPLSDTIAHERTMVVEFLDAVVTIAAVRGPEMGKSGLYDVNYAWKT